MKYKKNAQKVLDNIELIDKIVNQNKDNASDISKNSNEVYNMSQTLKAQLDKFKT
jgi:methyl-accepting chemotaxis protein